MQRRRRRAMYTSFIDATRPNAVKPHEVAARIAERDARLARDIRTPAAVLMNDPPVDLSALSRSIANVKQSLFVPIRTTFEHRTTLGRRTSPLCNTPVWKLTINRS